MFSILSYGMKWIAIAGSWRFSTPKLRLELENEVKSILNAGNGIITGGALGVDYLATQQVIKLNPKLDRLKVFLPSPLGIYLDHYKNRAQEGVISQNQAKTLEIQLKMINRVNPEYLVYGKHRPVNKRTYYLRNKLIIEVADQLIAFQVNKSLGTQQAINYAKKLNKPIKVFKYTT